MSVSNAFGIAVFRQKYQGHAVYDEKRRKEKRARLELSDPVSLI